MGLTDKHLAWGDDIPSEEEKTYLRQIYLEKGNIGLRMELKEIQAQVRKGGRKMKVNVSMDVNEVHAFQILLQTLGVELPDDPPEFKIRDGEIVCDYDDRGELYLALYHLATKIFPNMDFRHDFDNPNVLMSSLYTTKEGEDEND